MLERLLVFLLDIFFYHLLVSFCYGTYYSIFYMNKLFDKTEVLLGNNQKNKKMLLINLWLGFKYGVSLSIPYQKKIKRQKLY